MTVTSIILDRTICSKIEYLYMERYRSGHNGPDSKSCGELFVSSTKNLVAMRVLPGSKIEYVCCSFRQFFPKPFSIGKREGKTAAEHRGSGIEVVITGLTRNQVVLTGSWVRIPPAPPSKNPVTMRVSGFFFFCVRSKNHPIFSCSFRNFGKNSFLLYAPLFSAFCSHLLPKSPASGRGMPLTIACAEESFEL